MTKKQFLNKLNKRLKVCKDIIEKRSKNGDFFLPGLKVNKSLPSSNYLTLEEELKLIKRYLKIDNENEKKKIRIKLETDWANKNFEKKIYEEFKLQQLEDEENEGESNIIIIIAVIIGIVLTILLIQNF